MTAGAVGGDFEDGGYERTDDAVACDGDVAVEAAVDSSCAGCSGPSWVVVGRDWAALCAVYAAGFFKNNIFTLNNEMIGKIHQKCAFILF